VADEKLVLVMVGLPARGKTHIARKLARYLSWLGHRTKVFNVGSYRRARLGTAQPAEFFAPENQEARAARSRVAMEAIDDCLEWLKREGDVAIYDATNTARRQRDAVAARCYAAGAEIVFVESICDDQEVVESNIRSTKLLSPDYEGTDPDEAASDFRARIANYERVYERVADEEGSYVKLIDLGAKVIAHRIESYLPSRIVSFLLSSHVTQRPVFLTRHGESLWNLAGRIGGNPELSTRGEGYARALGMFLPDLTERLGLGDGVEGRPVVWTSTLRRAIQTARHLPWSKRQIRALDEIHAGVCEGMTYAQIEKQMPDEFDARARDKLRYRYPRGESYEDVIQRLEPVLIEIERQRTPVVVVAHNAVIRALYAYFMDWPPEVCPHLDVPLHTFIELREAAYGCEERRHALEPFYG
jgi:broad specificity phosphatase PhoE/predicted kinase